MKRSPEEIKERVEKWRAMRHRLRTEFVLIEHVRAVDECDYENLTDQQRIVAETIVSAHLSELEALCMRP